jgi:hypothetical protein
MKKGFMRKKTNNANPIPLSPPRKISCAFLGIVLVLQHYDRFIRVSYKRSEASMDRDSQLPLMRR